MHTDFHSEGKVSLASDFNDTFNVFPVTSTLRRLCHTCTFKLMSHDEPTPIVNGRHTVRHTPIQKTITQRHTHTGENTPTLERINLHPYVRDTLKFLFTAHPKPPNHRLRQTQQDIPEQSHLMSQTHKKTP